MINLETFNKENNFVVACCTFYEDKIVQTLLGSSFHPGGLNLTNQIGKQMNFSSSDKILDLASGLGASAIYLAQTFSCSVVGVDISKINVSKAQQLAKDKHVEHLVSFHQGDISSLPFEDNSFDYVISECSFCLFQDKNIVGREIYRILKPNGRVIITDIAIEKELPIDITNLIYKVACIASALSIAEYREYFIQNGFTIESIIDDKNILLKLAEDIKKKVFVMELASGLKKIKLQKEQLQEIKSLIKKAKQLLNDGYATYMTLIVQKKSL